MSKNHLFPSLQERGGLYPIPAPETRRKSNFAVVPLGAGGPSAGISFSGGLAETAETTETAGKWQAMLAHQAIGLTEATGTTGVSPVAWADNGQPMDSHRNAQDARCPSEPISCAKCQAGAIPVVLGVLFVLAAGARARSGQVPAPLPARRQDGGVPCGRNKLRPSRSTDLRAATDWDSRHP